MSLYGIISDLRREHPTQNASRTLDLVVSELGRTRDNLRLAVSRVEERPLPAGGKPILEELVERARMEGVDDLERGPAPDEVPQLEPFDEGTAGIGVLLGLSSLVVVLLAIAVVVAGIRQILR
jgi:hypothetical protein